MASYSPASIGIDNGVVDELKGHACVRDDDDEGMRVGIDGVSKERVVSISQQLAWQRSGLSRIS